MSSSRAVPSPRLRSSLVAAAAGCLILVLLTAIVVMAALEHRLTLQLLWGAAGLLVMMVVIAVVGLAVAWHQPRNPIGWLLLIVSAGFLLSIDGSEYATLYYWQRHPSPPLGPLPLLLAPGWDVGVAVFALVVALFPDGRLPSRRWQWIVWSYALAASVGPVGTEAVTIAAVAGHRISVTSDGNLEILERPSAAVAALFLVSVAAVALFWLAALVSQTLRWRRSSGERRQQLKWMLSGAAVCGLVGLPASVTSSAIWQVAILGFAALPVGIGVGVLRYRLYEIDRIISRTVGYALVTGLLVGLYAALVVVATRVLSFSSPVSVAGSTLAVAALVSPLRGRVQQAVDRRFNRARYDGDQMAAAFARRLQDAVDLTSIRADLVAVVHQALEPAHVSVWISQDGPPPAAPDSTPRSRARPTH